MTKASDRAHSAALKRNEGLFSAAVLLIGFAPLGLLAGIIASSVPVIVVSTLLIAVAAVFLWRVMRARRVLEREGADQARRS